MPELPKTVPAPTLDPAPTSQGAGMPVACCDGRHTACEAVNAHGQQAGLFGFIPELAIIVRAPAPDAAFRAQRAGMPAAGRNGGYPAFETADFHPERAVYLGAIAEPALGVATPSADAAPRRQKA